MVEAMSTAPCVLVVDDDPDIRGVLTVVLADAGYRVETAVNGSDGLDHVGCTPDLVLLDLGMPVMDGYEFIRHFREQATHRKTPIVVVSATVDGEVEGAQGFVRKPFENEALLRQVSDLLAA